MRKGRLAAIMAALVVQGCGGGGVSGPTPAASPQGNASPTKVRTSVAFTIAIPRRPVSPAERRREYVSTNTQSVVIQQLTPAPPYKPLGSPVIGNVTPTSPGCTPNSLETSCVFNFPAAPGTFNFSIQSFAALNGGGSLLAENTLTSATIVAGVANVLSVTLNGVIATISLPNSVAGTLDAPQTVNFGVLDASGATIIGTGTYDNGPITATDTTGLVTLSPASFAGPSNASSLSMQCTTSGSGSILFADASGALGTLSYSCSANPITLSPGSLDFDALAASDSDPTYDQTVTVTDQNQNVVSQTPLLACTPGPGSIGPTIVLAMSPSTDIWTIRPIDVGTCTFAVQDQLSDGTTESSQAIAIETHTANYTVASNARR